MSLSSDIWVHALLRRVQLAGAFATVVRKGDRNAGAVLVKTFDRRTSQALLWARATVGDGDSVWMRPLAATTENEIDAYVARAIRFDPDIWVVEIEDPDGRRFLTERVLDG